MNQIIPKIPSGMKKNAQNYCTTRQKESYIGMREREREREIRLKRVREKERSDRYSFIS